MGLDELTRPRTAEQLLARMLNVLSLRHPEHPLTNYSVGDPQRTLLELAAEGLSDTERLLSALAAGGYLATAAGEWLDALVDSQYDLQRQEATFAQGRLTLYAQPGSGPYTLEAGSVWAGTGTGIRFVTLEGGTLEAGGNVTLLAQAESPGSASNVTALSITTLHTALPGVRVSNEPGWLVQAGTDVESDVRLRARARARWAERGGGATRSAYVFWALSSTPAIDNVVVLDQHPRGQGTVDVVVWGQGGLPPTAVQAADAYIQARRPLTADVQVYAASEVIQVLALTLYAPGGDRARIEGEVLANLAALQQATPIGGTVYRSQVIEAAMLPAGMLDARLPDYVQDLVLGPVQAMTFNPHLDWR